MSSHAPWYAPLTDALAAEGENPTRRFVQLATVTSEGYPANRTVVFRGFLADEEALTFVTDARSRKVDHLRRCPRAEVCWYFRVTRQQFRLAGAVSVVTADDEEGAEARREAWADLSDGVRRQFLWPEPGAPRADDVGFDVPAPSAAKPVATFCLLLVRPSRVERLEIAARPHRRTLYLRGPSGAWAERAINP